jgi:hypothetical protein
VTALAMLKLPAWQTGPQPDPLTACLDAVARHDGRLFVALLAPHDRWPIRDALQEARQALAGAAAHHEVLMRELAPASSDEIAQALDHLLRAFAWAPRGDLAGYGAQLADDIAELRPSRRALRLGCRKIRLGERSIPPIAKVYDAIGAADRTVRDAGKHLGALPERIAFAENLLASRPRPP